MGTRFSRQVAAPPGSSANASRTSNGSASGTGTADPLAARGTGKPEGLDRGFCMVQLEASAHLRSISVRQLSTTLICVFASCSGCHRFARLDSWAIGMRRAAASSSPPGVPGQVSVRKPRPPKRQDHASWPALQDVII